VMHLYLVGCLKTKQTESERQKGYGIDGCHGVNVGWENGCGGGVSRMRNDCVVALQGTRVSQNRCR